MESSQPTFEPIAPGDRMQGLDALRGLALLMILVANMPAFNSPIYYLEDAGYNWWTSRVDHIFRTLDATFIHSESFALFSFLFGLGLAMQLVRAERAGVSLVPVYVRRLFVLIGIGLFHAFFIWTGDILALYGVLGFPLLLFRKLRPKVILGLAIAFYLLAPLRWELSLIRQNSNQAAATTNEVSYSSGVNSAQEEARQQVANSVAAYRDGTWTEITHQRIADYVYYWRHSQALTVFPLFLFGLYCGRRALFDGIPARLGSLRRVVAISFVIAVLGTILMRALYLQSISDWGILFRPLVYVIEHSALVTFYVTGMLLLSENKRFRKLTARLADAGRLALSNYLFQSVACTLLFYSYGLGLYGKVSPAQGFVVAAGVFAVELYLSTLWSRHFRFGPVEWAFRSITYGHVQRMTARDA